MEDDHQEVQGKHAGRGVAPLYELKKPLPTGREHLFLQESSLNFTLIYLTPLGHVVVP